MEKDKKSLILEGMLDLIKDHGFHGCPMSMLAKKAGVAAGTIYHYFDGKDILILTLHDYVTQQIRDTAEKGDNRELDFKTRFFNLWHILVQFYTSKPSIQRFFEQFMNSPYYNEEVQHAENIWHKWLKEFFSQGISEGALRSGFRSEILAIMVHGSIINCVRVKIFHGKKVDQEKINLDEIALVVWDGIKKQ